MVPVFPSINPAPIVLFGAIFAGLIIGISGWTVWLAVVRERLLLGSSGMLAALLVRLLTARFVVFHLVVTAVGLTVGVLPDRPDSRWARHELARLSGDRDLAFYIARLVVSVIAVFPVALVGVVLWAER